MVVHTLKWCPVVERRVRRRDRQVGSECPFCATILPPKGEATTDIWARGDSSDLVKVELADPTASPQQNLLTLLQSPAALYAPVRRAQGESPLDEFPAELVEEYRAEWDRLDDAARLWLADWLCESMATFGSVQAWRRAAWDGTLGLPPPLQGATLRLPLMVASIAEAQYCDTPGQNQLAIDIFASLTRVSEGGFHVRPGTGLYGEFVLEMFGIFGIDEPVTFSVSGTAVEQLLLFSQGQVFQRGMAAPDGTAFDLDSFRAAMAESQASGVPLESVEHLELVGADQSGSIWVNRHVTTYWSQGATVEANEVGLEIIGGTGPYALIRGSGTGKSPSPYPTVTGFVTAL